MPAILKNRMSRILAAAFVPATLGLILIGNNFAQGGSLFSTSHDDGPGGSGYAATTGSDNTVTDDGPGSDGYALDDDGPGLGGGYGPSGDSNMINLDGPGGSVPYL